MAADFRARSVGQGLRYKGRSGMWTWLLHRVTGLGILAFLILHVIDTAVVVYWPDLYDHALNLYKHPVFRFAELLIVFSVLYHALNGLRIIVQDLWPAAMQHYRALALGAVAVSAVVILPVAWIMLAPVFGLGPEPGAERHRQREEMRREAPVRATADAPVAPVSLEDGR